MGRGDYMDTDRARARFLVEETAKIVASYANQGKMQGDYLAETFNHVYQAVKACHRDALDAKD